MSTTKRISGSYTLATVNPTDQININSPTVIVNGNLFVTGNSQSVVSTDSAITNNKITLNAGIATPNPLGAQIEVDRGGGSYPNVQIRWNETVTNWQISRDGTTFANILSAGTGTIANVFADTTPAISANLDLRGHTIWDSVNSASNVRLSIGAVGTGGTGLYVANQNYSNVEIASKTRSIAYSILFG